MTAGSLCGPSCDAPVFLHVVGAVLLFGSVGAVTLLSLAALARPAEQAVLLRQISLWATLVLMVPSFILMRVGAQWVLVDEHLDKHSPGWVNAGVAISDGGVVAVILLTLIVWMSMRRPRLGQAAVAIGAIYLVALGVAWFAMSAKPGW